MSSHYFRNMHDPNLSFCLDAKKSTTSNANRGYYGVGNTWVPSDCDSSPSLVTELSKLGIEVQNVQK